MTALALRNLSKRYAGDSVGVRNLNLEVSEGELMVLVGPSGSGKSTALRLIAGLETPTEGEVLISGRLANHIPPRDRDIAMVFQDYALYPHLNVEQNLAFPLKMRKMPRDEIHTRVRQAAEMLGIADFLKRKPKELSGGQRQRVALGRALVRDPKVFLFDEPLSNLDASLRTQLRQEIKHIHDELEATMVYVTHDQSEAMSIGERIAVMNAGTIEQVGTPAELYRQPQSEFVASFLGNPPMNLVGCDAHAESGALEITCRELNCSLTMTTARPSEDSVRTVTLGFRPEDVQLGKSTPHAALAGTANVSMVEAMGAETCVHLETATLKFLARVLGYIDIHPNSQISFSVPMDKLHLFDSSTEKRIQTRQPS